MVVAVKAKWLAGKRGWGERDYVSSAISGPSSGRSTYMHLMPCALADLDGLWILISYDVRVVIARYWYPSNFHSCIKPVRRNPTGQICSRHSYLVARRHSSPISVVCGCRAADPGHGDTGRTRVAKSKPRPPWICFI